MAKRTFEVDGLRFEAGNRCTMNGVQGRIWTLWQHKDSAWIHCAKTFARDSLTRDELRHSFEWFAGYGTTWIRQ